MLSHSWGALGSTVLSFPHQTSSRRHIIQNNGILPRFGGKVFEVLTERDNGLAVILQLPVCLFFMAYTKLAYISLFIGPLFILKLTPLEPYAHTIFELAVVTVGVLFLAQVFSQKPQR